MTRRRATRGAAIAILAAVAVLGWGLPNVAGPALIEIRLVAAGMVVPAAPVRTVVIGGGGSVTATSLRLAVRVTGTYFLPVTVGGGGEPLRVELRSHAPDGSSVLVWTVTGGAETLGRGDDSPDGPSGSRAYLVDPGTIELQIGPPEGVALLDGSGLPLEPGRYDLRAVAFGVASGVIPLSIAD